MLSGSPPSSNGSSQWFFLAFGIRVVVLRVGRGWKCGGCGVVENEVAGKWVRGDFGVGVLGNGEMDLGRREDATIVAVFGYSFFWFVGCEVTVFGQQ